MTELTFLIELLLNHDLQKDTKDLIAGRIKEVEAELNSRQPVRATGQAPSTMALMAQHVQPTPTVQDVQAIGQTAAAQAALAYRQAAINASMNDKIDKNARSPRKW